MGSRPHSCRSSGLGGPVTVGIWSCWCCGSARFKVPVLGTNRDVSRRHLRVLTGRKTERPLSAEPEAAQEICGGAGTKPHISRSVLFLPGGGPWFNLTLSGCRGKVLPGLCQLLARALRWQPGVWPGASRTRPLRCKRWIWRAEMSLWMDAGPRWRLALCSSGVTLAWQAGLCEKWPHPAAQGTLCAPPNLRQYSFSEEFSAILIT